MLNMHVSRNLPIFLVGVITDILCCISDSFVNLALLEKRFGRRTRARRRDGELSYICHASLLVRKSLVEENDEISFKNLGSKEPYESPLDLQVWRQVPHPVETIVRLDASLRSSGLLR